MYSQNDEEKYILKYFAGATSGTFLDIGAFHPKTFSNTRALYEQGFKGVFIEPSPALLPAFEAEYGSDEAIQILPVCVGNKVGTVDFFDSGGDAISTTVQSETRRWEEQYNSQFKRITREMVTIEELLRRSRYKVFDFINVDTEGNVLEIVEQIDARALGVKLMCVEWNGADRSRFEAYFARHRMRPLMTNGENMICGV
ncbi:MAG: FkbM family methyltransferase [Hyphomicrobiaceae bacterium]